MRANTLSCFVASFVSSLTRCAPIITRNSMPCVCTGSRPRLLRRRKLRPNRFLSVSRPYTTVAEATIYAIMRPSWRKVSRFSTFTTDFPPRSTSRIMEPLTVYLYVWALDFGIPLKSLHRLVISFAKFIPRLKFSSFSLSISGRRCLDGSSIHESIFCCSSHSHSLIMVKVRFKNIHLDSLLVMLCIIFSPVVTRVVYLAVMDKLHTWWTVELVPEYCATIGCICI